MKSTQEDDSAAYADVEKSIKSLKSRTHEDDWKEALRLVRRASFAHNNSNVIGAPMASELVEHGSRFYFSHSFTYGALKDIIKLLNNSEVDAVAKYNLDGSVYYENLGLHYLCRPDELEDCCVKDFFENYKAVRLSLVAKKRKRKKGEPEV
jgi:hypothetical protein